MGVIYDVIIDLRVDSTTFKQWFAIELSAENHLALYVPENFVHGFQSQTENSEVLYQMSEFFHPECARGLRWDDPAFGIEWLLEEKVLSEKDKSWPYFEIEKYLPQ
jgi:dTDP-4-dehydrorhamnose 3,5-epimerase